MSLRELPLIDLSRRCHDETVRFLRGEARDDTFCYELFSRAIVQRDDSAWSAIVGQYRGIVLAYIGQHTLAGMLHEPDNYWVNRAFQRFWSAITADRFARFPDLAALLKYLKLCVHSVLMDEIRARRVGTLSSLEDVPETAAVRGDAEGSVVGRLAGEELWAAIIREMQDEPERVVAYLSFTRDMKPSDIFERHPRLYESVADVYRIKRNVLERLRRSAQIRAFLST
jgi:hypothetical protein